jgi:N-methylhydantoinase A
VEVGSGGGSIAWLDPQNRLHVGPRSAGSTPGPACYGRGGTLPTVTDANLVLGRLDPDRFLGGELVLNSDLARTAVAQIATPLGYTGPEGATRMAEGILSLASVIMAGAIKQVSIEHGRDPREFVLFCYGGSGPLHAGALARELSIPTVVIPPEPGNFSAVGMLLADARLDLSKTFVGPLDQRIAFSLPEMFGEMEGEARAALARDFGAGEVLFERYVEMRYVGQRHNIKVPIPARPDVDGIRQAFGREYQLRYGHSDGNAAAELQALHLSAFRRLARPDLERLPRAPAASGCTESRLVYFGQADGMRDAEVYQRVSLPPGFQGRVPAVIEEYGSTTLVWPDDRFEIGRLGEICIHLTQAGTR